MKLNRFFKLILFLLLFFPLVAFAFEIKQNKETKLKGKLEENQFIISDTITIEGESKEDLFLLGNQIFLKGKFNDVFLLGKEIYLEGEAKDLIGGALKISLPENSLINGNFYFVADQIEIKGKIKKKTKLIGNEIKINGEIENDVKVIGPKISIGSKTKIKGDLIYVSENELDLDKNAKIKGKIIRKFPERIKPSFKNKLIINLIALISLLLLGAIIFFFTPKISLSIASTIIEKPWLSLGIGFLTLILLPFLSLLLILTIFGIPLGIILLLGYILLIYLSKVYFILAFGKKLFPKYSLFSSFFLGLILYQILLNIPFLGLVFWILTICLGIGGILLTKRKLLFKLEEK